MAITEAQILAVIEAQIDEEGADALATVRKVLAKILRIYGFDNAEIAALRDGQGVTGETAAFLTAAAQGAAWADARANVPEFETRVETRVRGRLQAAAESARTGTDRIRDLREALSGPNAGEP